MLEDKIDRLIVIVRGELPPKEQLDKDLVFLLTTKTYLVWGEKWFWEKLRYALPHKKSAHQRKSLQAGKNQTISRFGTTPGFKSVHTELNGHHNAFGQSKQTSKQRATSEYMKSYVDATIANHFQLSDHTSSPTGRSRDSSTQGHIDQQPRSKRFSSSSASSSSPNESQSTSITMSTASSSMSGNNYIESSNPAEVVMNSINKQKSSKSKPAPARPSSQRAAGSHERGHDNKAFVIETRTWDTPPLSKIVLVSSQRKIIPSFYWLMILMQYRDILKSQLILGCYDEVLFTHRQPFICDQFPIFWLYTEKTYFLAKVQRLCYFINLSKYISPFSSPPISSLFISTYQFNEKEPLTMTNKNFCDHVPYMSNLSLICNSIP